MIITKVPEFAKDLEEFPEVASTMIEVKLPFYCCNCLRKRTTYYLTPDFGPFCFNCIQELKNNIGDVIQLLMNVITNDQA